MNESQAVTLTPAQAHTLADLPDLLDIGACTIRVTSSNVSGVIGAHVEGRSFLISANGMLFAPDVETV